LQKFTDEDDDDDDGRQVMAIPHMTGLTSGVAGRFECPAPEREDLLSTPP